MKIAGLVGGIGPESTVVYYRRIVAGWSARSGDGSYPSVLVNSIDLARMIGLIGAGRLDDVTDFLAGEIERLAVAGAAFGALASNTPHVVFDRLRERSRIPLVSIVEVAREAARGRGLRRRHGAAAAADRAGGGGGAAPRHGRAPRGRHPGPDGVVAADREGIDRDPLPETDATAA